MFTPIIQHDKCQWTLYKGPQGNLASFVQMIRSYLGNQRSIGTNVWEGSRFHNDKNFCPFSLVVSIVTTLKERFKKVQKLFLSLLYILWEHSSRI